MTIPPEAEIRDAVLKVLLANGGRSQPRDVVLAVTQELQHRLTDDDLALQRRDGSPLWENHVHWARLHLAQDGFIDRSERGVWALTPAGELRAQALPSLEPSAPPQSTEPVESSLTSPNQVVQTMLLALLQEVTNAELPWTVEHLDDGSVALSYDGRLRVILQP